LLQTHHHSSVVSLSLFREVRNSFKEDKPVKGIVAARKCDNYG
jgi:hypothetical protein